MGRQRLTPWSASAVTSGPRTTSGQSLIRMARPHETRLLPSFDLCRRVGSKSRIAVNVISKPERFYPRGMCLRQMSEPVLANRTVDIFVQVALCMDVGSAVLNSSSELAHPCVVFVAYIWQWKNLQLQNYYYCIQVVT